MRPSPFYTGDGIAGIRAWAWARFLWRILPARFAPALPRSCGELHRGRPCGGWAWNVRKDGRGLYSRHDG